MVILLSMAILSLILFGYGSSENLEEKDHAKIENLGNKNTFKPASDPAFTVMTYNIGYLSGMTNNTTKKSGKKFFENNLLQSRKLLSDVNPDIVAFQEIDFDSWRSYETDQAEQLARNRYPFLAKAVNWDKKYVPFPYGLPNVHFGKIVSGQAILSRFPIITQKIDTLSQVKSVPFYYNQFYLERLAQTAILQLGKRKLAVINLHLEAFDAPTRAKQTQYVLNLFRKTAQKYPTIMLGDFNSSPDEKNPTISILLNSGLSTVDLDRNHLEYTFSSAKPYSRLDYIFYSKELTLIKARVVKEASMISDHLPVEANFRFNN